MNGHYHVLWSGICLDGITREGFIALRPSGFKDIN